MRAANEAAGNPLAPGASAPDVGARSRWAGSSGDKARIAKAQAEFEKIRADVAATRAVDPSVP